MPPAIEIIGLSKEFRVSSGFLKPARTLKVLDSINLSVDEGEIFALLGPNGAGKTTLIKILCSLVLPTSGKAKICGYDVVREEKLSRAALSLVVGEERSFYWRLTGRQNLEFFSALYGLSRKESAGKIEDAAQVLEMNYLDRRFQEYSSGMKHRLALARCLLSNASVIFMDEPTKSLDPVSAANLRELIRNFSREKGKTIFFSSHDLAEVENLADSIAVLEQGAIRCHSSMEELRHSPDYSSLQNWFQENMSAEPDFGDETLV